MAYTPAGNLTTTPSITHLASVWYNKTALDQLMKRFKFLGVTERDAIPLRSGKTVQWFRYTLFAAATGAHAEGAVGVGSALTSTTLSATVAEYADFITISTLLEETAIDPITQSAAEQLGYKAGISVDTITRIEFDSNAAAETDPIAGVGGVVVVNDLRKNKALLEGKDVLPREGDDFVAIMSPYCLYDIQADATAGGFIDVLKYAEPGRLLTGEAGRISGVRIILSTNVKTAGVAPAQTFWIYLVGKGAVGSVDLAGSGPSRVEDPTKQSFKINTIRGGPQIADPEGMIGSAVSYRFVFAAKTLDSDTFRYTMIKAGSSII